MNRPGVLLAVLCFTVVAPQVSAQGLIFADGFENGDPCAWSDVTCLTEAQLEQNLGVQLSVDFCVPPNSYDLPPYGSFGICYSSTCGDGSSGCPGTISVELVDLDFQISSGQIDFGISDVTIDVDLPVGGCDVVSTQNSFATTFSIGIAPMCPPTIDEIWNVGNTTGDMSANIDTSDCGALGSVIALLADVMIDDIESLLLNVLGPEIEGALIHQLLCAQ